MEKVEDDLCDVNPLSWTQRVQTDN